MSEPEWIKSLTGRLDNITATLGDISEEQGSLHAGLAHVGRELRMLRESTDKLCREFSAEKVKRRDEDIAIRKELSSTERRMNTKNAGAGAAAGAVLLLAEWLVKHFGG